MLEFYKTQIKPQNDKLGEALKVKKNIVVYEEVIVPGGMIVTLPVKKVKSYKALGLSLRGRNG